MLAGCLLGYNVYCGEESEAVIAMWLRCLLQSYMVPCLISQMPCTDCYLGSEFWQIETIQESMYTYTLIHTRTYINLVFTCKHAYMYTQTNWSSYKLQDLSWFKQKSLVPCFFVSSDWLNFCKAKRKKKMNPQQNTCKYIPTRKMLTLALK